MTNLLVDETLKARLDEVAASTGRSQSDIIREGITAAAAEPPRRLGMKMTARASGLGILDNYDKLMEDFGK